MNPLPLIGYDAQTARGWARLKYFWRDVVAAKWRQSGWPLLVHWLRRSAGLHPNHN